MKQKQWANRLRETADVDPKTLLANPYNHRIHGEYQIAALSGSLKEIGIWQHVTVNRRTGRIVDGHARVALAIREGQESVPVSYVEMTEEQEAAAIASGDAITALADTDGAKVQELLQHVSTEDPALTELFAMLRDDAGRTVLEDVDDDGAGGGSEPAEKGNGSRNMGDRKAQIKPVLYAAQVQTFEQALLLAVEKTGSRNRGECLIAICQAYLEHGESQDEVAALLKQAQ